MIGVILMRSDRKHSSDERGGTYDSCDSSYSSELSYITHLTGNMIGVILNITHTSPHHHIHLKAKSHTLHGKITHTSWYHHTHFTVTSILFTSTSHTLHLIITHTSPLHHTHLKATSHTLHHSITHTSRQHHTHFITTSHTFYHNITRT